MADYVAPGILHELTSDFHDAIRSIYEDFNKKELSQHVETWNGVRQTLGDGLIPLIDASVQYPIWQIYLTNLFTLLVESDAPMLAFPAYKQTKERYDFSLILPKFATEHKLSFTDPNDEFVAKYFDHYHARFGDLTTTWVHSPHNYVSILNDANALLLNLISLYIDAWFDKTSCWVTQTRNSTMPANLHRATREAVQSRLLALKPRLVALADKYQHSLLKESFKHFDNHNSPTKVENMALKERKSEVVDVFGQDLQPDSHYDDDDDDSDAPPIPIQY